MRVRSILVGAGALALAGSAAADTRSLQLVLGAVDMRGARDGFAVRTFDGIVRSVARTRDGGRTFDDVAELDRLGLRGARTIASPDGRTVIAAGDGWVLRSTNGGRSFARVDVPADLSYRKLAFAGATATGWLLGVRSDEDLSGPLFLTLDAGRTFRARTPAREAHLRDFAFVDPARGFAVDERGIVRTRDGGVTFEPVRGAPSGAYSAVAADGRLVLAAGARLARSTDGGEHWETLPLPTDGAIGSIEILDARRWVLGGDGGLAWRSENGGRDWAQLAPSPGRGAPRFASEARAYAAGSAVLYVSADAGDTWQPADPGHREDIDTEEGATPERVLLAGEEAGGGEAEGPGAADGGGAPTAASTGRGHGAGAEGGGEGENSAEAEALRDLEGQGVPQSALQRAQRAAERMARRRGGRGGRGAPNWIKGAARRGIRR